MSRLKRLMYILIVLALIGIVLVVMCKNKKMYKRHNRGVLTYHRSENITSYLEAKKLLKKGNKRFVSTRVLNDDLSSEKRKALSEKGQNPFAVILSCSDSRVPPEVIFDQGLGDIFTIRNAGNVIDTSTLGSIEYGAEHLKIPLIVVLGHEKCGAVKSTVDGEEAKGSINTIIEKIKPSFNKIKETEPDKNLWYEKCENENIKNTVVEIKKSPIIKKLEGEKKVKVISAKYRLESGMVSFNIQ